MSISVKHRLIGAAVLVAIGSLMVPFLMDNPPGEPDSIGTNIPVRPESPPESTVDHSIEQDESQKLRVLADPDENAFQPEPAITSVDLTESEAVNDVQTTSDDSIETLLETDYSSEERAQNEVREITPDIQAGQHAYAIQLGSFKNKVFAKRLITQLLDDGYSAYVRPANPSKSGYSRVLVGPELVWDDAHQLKDEINNRYSLNAIVINFEPLRD